MKQIIWSILFAVVVSFTYTAVPAQAVILPKTAKLLPPETVLLVDIDNFSGFKGQLEKTSFYKLYKDPAMAAFVENFETKLREKVQRLDGNNIIRTFYEAGIWPRGRMAFALVFNEQYQDANELPVLFISQWDEKIGKIKDAISKMAEKNIEYGGHQKRSEDYRGVSIETAIDEGASVLYYCFVDDCFMATDGDLDLLKFAIAHIKGSSSPTLADDADYTAATKAVGPYHEVDFYVNINQIIKTKLAKDSTGQVRTTIANLGFDNVASLGASLGLGRVAGSNLSGKAFLKINGAKKGVIKMLDVESAVIRVPRFISASAFSTFFMNLNIKNVYNELYNILYSFDPELAKKMQEPLLPAGPDGQPPLQLKTDIIDHLGSQIVITKTINRPFSHNSAPTDLLFAASASNPRALEKSMSILHSMITENSPDTRRELLGHTIYLIDMRGMPFLPFGLTPLQAPGQPAPPPMPKLAFAVTETHLIFGTESTVEGAVRTLNSTGAASVASAKWFGSAKSAVPSVLGLADLEDNSAQAELLWWMMKETGKATGSNVPIVPGPAMMFSQLGKDLFDFTLLPRYEVVKKYFGVAATYGISRPDGFFFEFRDVSSTGGD